jgi:hypothetical protein
MSDSRNGRDRFTLEDLRSDAWAGDEDLTAFVADVEKTYVSTIDLETESRHIALMLDELRVASWEPKVVRSASWAQAKVRVRVRRRRFRLAIQLATALASVTVFIGGFAVANVGAPDDTLADTTATAGAGDAGTASAGRAASLQALLDYIDTTPDEGCAFGQGVAAIATQGRGGNAEACDQGGAEQGEAADHAPQGSRATGTENSAGRAGGAAGAQGSPATGQENSAGHAGGGGAQGSSATGAESSDGAGGTGAQGSRATGQEHSGGAAEDAADTATENAPVDVRRGPPTDL